MNASNQRIYKGIHSYQSSCERVEPNVPPKKESLFTTQLITKVSTKTRCQNNCLQHFPCGQIQALLAQLHVHNEVYAQKKALLKVHWQIYKDNDSKQWITLKGREVCPKAWWTIHGITKATFYRYKE